MGDGQRLGHCCKTSLGFKPWQACRCPMQGVGRGPTGLAHSSGREGLSFIKSSTTGEATHPLPLAPW